MAISDLSAARARRQSFLEGKMAAFDMIDGESMHGLAARMLEDDILGSRATTAAELIWKVQFGARALDNGWEPAEGLPIFASIERDIVALAERLA